MPSAAEDGGPHTPRRACLTGTPVAVNSAVLSCSVLFRLLHCLVDDDESIPGRSLFIDKETSASSELSLCLWRLALPDEPPGLPGLRCGGFSGAPGEVILGNRCGLISQAKEWVLSRASWILNTLQVALVVKNPPANSGEVRNAGSIPGSGRSPGGNGNPHQYSCLENPMDREA